MTDSTRQSPETVLLTRGGRFTWRGLLIGVVGGLLIGAILAWGAEVAQNYAAPWLLFPLLVGAGTGIGVIGLARIAQIGHRPTIILSVVLAACTATAGQHYAAYLDTYFGHVKLAPPLSPMQIGPDGSTTAVTPPSDKSDLSAAMRRLAPSFGQYLQTQIRQGRPLFADYRAAGWLVWTSWILDGLLLLAAAVAVTLPALRTPYCDRCRTWYRVTRNGRIDVPVAENLAALAGFRLPEHTRSRRYRLSNCRGGCSATFCELSWEDAGGRLSLVSFWLDAAQRNEALAILDGVASETDEDD